MATDVPTVGDHADGQNDDGCGTCTDDQQRLILEILSYAGVIRGKTKLVKIIHMVCSLLEKGGVTPPFCFYAGRFGAHSPSITPALRTLLDNDAVAVATDKLSGRQDIALADTNAEIRSCYGAALSGRISDLVTRLNELSGRDVIAISYDMFRDTTTNSMIRPEIHRRIGRMFDVSMNHDTEPAKPGLHAPATPRHLHAPFNDYDVRVEIAKSIGLDKPPPIIPDMIDKSTGLLKKYGIFDDMSPEEELRNARRR